MNDELREQLADLCHKQWSNWMRFLFANCETVSDGQMIIPSWAAKRWKRQMMSDYSELPEVERGSGQNLADEFIEIFIKSQESTQ